MRDERDDERQDELDQLHAPRWKLLERADDPCESQKLGLRQLVFESRP
jgi:hypothetical protein